MADAETKTVPLRRMKAAASLDLSDPSQLTMKEIIRRAEAIERAVSVHHNE
jgi:transcription factor TFIIIB component B''